LPEQQPPQREDRLSYADTRDSEQLRILDDAVTQFIQRYNSNPSRRRRRTLFLFPGGMGCQLLRATKPYRDNVAARQTFHYDKVWLTLGTFAGDALTLRMRKDNQGVYRDLANRIIIADGAVELCGLTPYSKFTAWCELNHLDWFIFGWDWRRRLEETVTFFLSRFLPQFQSTVKKACRADPLRNFVLVGHSFGGMIVNLILRQPDPLLANMTRAVTVAAPFYGYDGQIHRWFEGEKYLNHLGKMKVVRAISSMPACYALPYLDAVTYSANQTALAQDPQFPLAGYPSRDAANPAQIADPFNPVGQRYPGNTDFDCSELNHGRQICQQLAAPLTQYADRFFNIRGVQSTPDTVVGGINWKLLPKPANPRKSPITNRPPQVSGDGVQPGWSTRHVALPSSQLRTVAGVDHMFMMEYHATHDAIAKVL
jgi:pimeloyl-ACP methyl ester carboxylesterase